MMKLDSLADAESIQSIQIVYQDFDATHNLIERLELSPAKGLIVLNAGTFPESNHVKLRIKTLINKLAEIVVEDGLTVIDEGVTTGVFKLFNDALEKLGGPCAPYIGVANQSNVERYGLGSQHSHIVLPKACNMENGTKIIYHLAKTIDTDCPSISLFVGGGELAIEQMLTNVCQQRKMLFFAGSKGSTDQVLHSGVMAEASDIRFRKIFYEGQIVPFGIYQPATTLKSTIRGMLIP
jgi:hypothetical protein